MSTFQFYRLYKTISKKQAREVRIRMASLIYHLISKAPASDFLFLATCWRPYLGPMTAVDHLLQREQELWSKADDLRNTPAGLAHLICILLLYYNSFYLKKCISFSVTGDWGNYFCFWKKKTQRRKEIKYYSESRGTRTCGKAAARRVMEEQPTPLSSKPSGKDL